MKKAPLHPQEQQRLESLKNLNILDTLPEREFDDITFLASQICDSPIALISLVDEKRQWFKSKIGLTSTETPRDYAFCAHAILKDDIFIVQDSHRDERFADNPLVTGEPFVRFYAGTPLLSPEGYPIGTLCVIDSKPKTLTEKQSAALKALSRQVSSQIELKIQIEEIKSFQQKIVDSESSTQLVLDELPAMVGQWSIDLINLTSNLAYKEFFRSSQTEIKGMHMKELIGEELFQKNLPFIQEALRGIPQTFERDIPMHDGSVKNVLTSYIPIKKREEVCSFLAITTDISRVKLLERQRLDLEIRLGESSRLSIIGEMTANFAHEINNPLQILKLTSSSIERKIKSNAFESITKDCTTIDQTVDRIAKIINSLRVFSKTSKGDSLETMNALNAVESALTLCNERFKNNSIKIRFNCNSSLKFEGYPTQILQLMMNLLTNSFDAILNLSEKWIDIQVTSENNTLKFVFKDSGHGIIEPIAQKMMQPFYSTKDPRKNIGLGLSTSKNIVEMHNGSLQYDSLAENTTFVLILPLTQTK